MGLKRIPLNQIVPNPKQPRPPEEFDEASLNELADTIEAEGLKQAITVRPIDDGNGTLMLVFGERRWRAHGILAKRGLTQFGTILANVRRMDDRQMAIEAILENMARKDLSVLAEARQWRNALDSGIELADLARRSGVAQWRITYRLQLLNLDPSIQGMLAKGQISSPMAHELGRHPSHSEQMKLVRLIASGQLTNEKQVAAAVNALLNPQMQEALLGLDMPEGPSPEELAQVSAMEARIERVLAAVAGGWKDGECVVARRVAPDRAAVVAEKLAALRVALKKMEDQLRAAAVTGTLALQQRAA